MQLICKYKPKPINRRPAVRRALTLLELVVVLAILVALSGMVVPLIEGLGYQTNASTNATVVNDVNRAVGAYAAGNELGQFPSGWDSLLNTSEGLFVRLHENLSGTTGSNPIVPLVAATALTATQAASMTSAGIGTVFDVVETGGDTSPNAFTSELRTIQAGGKLATLVSTTGSYSDAAFRLQHLEAADPGKKFVVLGLGGMTSLRGKTMREVPLISSADPNNHYARVLCVFMLPSDTDTTSFAAKYVGCFLPDGTSQRMNLDAYNNLRN